MLNVLASECVSMYIHILGSILKYHKTKYSKALLNNIKMCWFLIKLDRLDLKYFVVIVKNQ